MNRRKFLNQMGVAGMVVGAAGTSAFAQAPVKDSNGDREKNDLKWPKRPMAVWERHSPVTTPR